MIRQASEPVGNAAELSLRRTITLIDQPTTGASAGRISGINEHHGHPSQSRLVAHELAQLEERPTAQRSPLGPANREPVVNALEIFQRDPTSGAFGHGHEALADRVVHIGCEASFCATPLSEESLGAAGSLGLQSLTELPMPATQSVDLRAGVDRAITVGGNVDDPKVNPKPLRGLTRWLLDIDRGEEVPTIIAKDEVRFSLPELQQCTGSLATNERDALPADSGPDRDLGAVNIPAENPVIEGDGAVRLEGPPALPVQLVGIGYLGDAADHDLCREARDDARIGP